MATPDRGDRVEIVGQTPLAYSPSFVGWGAYDYDKPGAEQGLVKVPAGSLATVTGLEQHGSAPFTRLVLEVDGVGRVAGADPEAVILLDRRH